jgi:hypothetical protein
MRESVTRPIIKGTDISYNKREKSKLGYKTSKSPLSGQQKELGYSLSKKRIQDPFAANQRSIARSTKRSLSQVGFRNEESELTFTQFRQKLNEATYKGKTVPLNKPMAGDVKKSKVFVDPDGDGKAQKVNFGDKSMTIKKHIPSRRKSFRARHNCDNPGPKTKARYWSCKAW